MWALLKLVGGSFVRVPVICAAQEDSRCILLSFLFREEMHVGIALVVMCAWAGGVGFGIEHCLDGMCFTGMPLAPAGRVDMAAHLRIEIDDRGIGTPRSAKIDGSGYIRATGKLAVVENEAGILGRIVL